ncbi:MAG: ATP-binding cassette domain-containing protein [Firmicutes bacterium]|nr:ATP-binding cassette domain-containing protein [Bacillota bacterium]
MIYLSTGKTFQTHTGRNAYRICSGRALVFLVPEKEGIFQRPLNLMKAEAGVTVPGLLYTDGNYVTWRLQLEATEECELQEIRDGVTTPLKKKFLQRASISPEGETDFARILTEHYVSKVLIEEDLFIYKSAQARENDRREALETIRGVTEGGRAPSKTPSREKSETRKEQALILHWIRAARRLLPVMEPKRLALVSLLTAAAGACGLLMAAGADFFSLGQWRAALAVCVFLAAFMAFRSLARAQLLREANRIAGLAQQEKLEEVFLRGIDAAALRDRRARAVSLLYEYDRVEQAIMNLYESGSGVVLAAVFWGFMLTRSSAAAAAAAVLTIIGGVLIYCGRRAARPLRRRAGQIRRGAERSLYQYLANIAKVRLSGASEYVIRQYYTEVAEQKRAERAAWQREVAGKLLMRCFAGAAVFAAAALPFGILQGSLPHLPAAVITGLLVCFEGLRGSLGLVKLRAEADPLRGLAAEKKEHLPGSSDEPEDRSGDGSGTRRGPLILNHGSFSYEGRTVLEEISCSVSEGEYLGIAGPSGCGKSTLLRILSAMAPADQGTLYFDGCPITEDNPQRIRTHAGIVLQDDQLLGGSIRENILAGRPGTGDYSLTRAAELALLTDDIAQMPMGYETLISERAETVSAGQKQKILLARALISQPQILFLDEAESELDQKTQEMLYENIRREVSMGVIVSHHYRTLSKCDRIIVLENGKITEEGTPDELIRREGHFFRLMRQQLVTDSSAPGIQT